MRPEHVSTADDLPEWAADPNGFGGEQWGNREGFCDDVGRMAGRFGFGLGVAYGHALNDGEGVSAMLSVGLACGFGSRQYFCKD